MALASERHNPKLDDDVEARPERWLLSYSDLVTTLMVLFLALYAIQLAKYHELEIKLLEASRSVKNDKAPAAVATLSPPGSPTSGAPLASKTELLSLLKVLRDKGQINIDEQTGGVEIGINAKVLFRPGDAHLLPDSTDVLDQVAAALKDYSTHNILVEGHTDSTPISNAKYESNWELSSARAGAVVRFFVDKGIEPHRLAAIGRSDNIPLMIGDDAVARAANRRVTILVQY
ncbi:OmpA family protein [Paraburkholderia phenazinium]|uniref:Chemotaxis protein MotB n=1 Tax=Paraburkholderia phenazinium TaxID=60549 RepID=A0A1G8BKA6_9BURK|nr:OmpA family protein [Paraburkholderia phenazinium]SDH33635.1 chemotaxis protein MotB [Paraburkholderia phenazinium]